MGDRLDNLIPLHASLSPRQLAGWEPGAAVETDLGVHLHADVRIPMADGTKLAADVYVPKRPGRYPVILHFASYNLDLDTAAAPVATNEIASPAVMVPRGYVQIVITARGVGRSGGELQLWLSEPLVDDLELCVGWAAAQEWSDGQVAMFGTSYFGLVQPLLAVRRPPALKAFFACDICVDYQRHIFRPGGNLNLDFLTLWSGANFAVSSIGRHVPPVVRATLSWMLAHHETFKLVRPHLEAIQAGFKEHRGIHPFVLRWLTVFISGEEGALVPPAPEGPARDLAKIDVPFVVVQNRGQVALNQFGAYEVFERAGSPRDRRWLIVGPAEYDLPVSDWQLEALAFFDHVLKGADNGYARQPRVRFFRDGTDDWGANDTFPPTPSAPLVLHLAPGEALATSPPAGGETSWLAVPRGSAILPEITEITPESVVFRWTAPRTLELFGPTTLSLRFSSNEIDSFIAARLDLVTAADKRTPLGFGTMRPAARATQPDAGSAAEIANDPRSRVPLVPFEPCQLRFSMTPVCVRLAAGDRLELRIGSRPEQIRVSPSEGFILPDVPVPFFARNKVHFGPDTRLTVTTLS
jgi:predicted acyl esterase